MKQTEAHLQKEQYRLRRRVLNTCLIVVAWQSLAFAQTSKFLDAPLVQRELAIRWEPGAKVVQWQKDDQEPYAAFQADALFLTKGSVYVTIHNLNPLRMQGSATVTAADDPGYGIVGKLLGSLTDLMSTVGLVEPALETAKAAAGKKLAAANAPPCASAVVDIDQLRRALYGTEVSGKTIATNLEAWVQVIDAAFKEGKSGPEAIALAAKAIRKNAEDLKAALSAGTKVWATITACAESVPIGDDQKTAYSLAAITHQEGRIKQVKALQSAVAEMADTLDKDYAPDTKWMGKNLTDYVLGPEIHPTFSKMQSVTAKIGSAKYSYDEETESIAVEQKSLGTASFTVRKYSTLTPEIGVGAVFGSIKKPQYGTDKDKNGQTIVARVPDKSISVNPSILVNFVCRCGSGYLTPMVQIGVATSKDLPALLFGGGLRLFGLGKGDVAIGGGGMFGWYQDLQKLHPGDVVSGTKDIDADLGFASRPKVGGYFAIQYKF